MVVRAAHLFKEHIANSFSDFTIRELVKRHRCVLVDNSADGLEWAVSSSAEHFKKTTFSCRVDKLMDGNVLLNDLKVKLGFNLLRHVQNCLPHYTIKETFVIDRGNEFEVTKT